MSLGFVIGVFGVLILSHAAYSTIQYWTLLKITEEEFSEPPINMNSDRDTYFTDLLYGDEQLEGEHIDLSTESSQIPLKTESITKKVPRSQNFSIDEDILVVLAWFNISVDAIHANEQKIKTYWKRIHEYFHHYKTFLTERNSNSLMNRWSSIQLAVNKFCGCYAQIEGRPKSGVNEQDKILKAKLMYHEVHKVPFQFEHCWNELRFQPKWQEVESTKKAKKRSTTSDPTQDTINLGEDDAHGESVVEIERPIGIKVEKERLKKHKNKKEGGDSFVVSLLKEMRDEKKQMTERKMEYFERTYAQDQERLCLKKRELRMQQEEMDDRLMSIDTTILPPYQVEYYKQRQNEILEKRSRT